MIDALQHSMNPSALSGSGLVTLLRLIIVLRCNVLQFEGSELANWNFYLVSISGACCIRRQCGYSSNLLPRKPRHGSRRLWQNWKEHCELIPPLLFLSSWCIITLFDLRCWLANTRLGLVSLLPIYRWR
jgi:hypothetical protein